MPLGMYLGIDCEGSHSKTQVFVSNYLLCIARPRIEARKYTHKFTFSGVDCEVSQSSHEAASKIIVVRAIRTTELVINLKRILCIRKGPNCVQIVLSLRIRPQSNLVLHEPQHSR